MLFIHLSAYVMAQLHRWTTVIAVAVMSGFTFGGSNGVGPTNTATGARLNVGTPGVAPAPGLYPSS